MSMDNAGKIIFAKHSEILQANLKNLGGTFSLFVFISSYLQVVLEIVCPVCITTVEEL